MSQPNQNAQYDAHGRPLVAPAERPFMPFQEQETVQETVWLNPTDKDAVLDLYVGVQPVYSKQLKDLWKLLTPGQLRERQRGLRRYIIRAGDRRSIPSEFDQAIQQTHCQEQDCASRPLYCRDNTHHKMVVGGYGPQLINEKAQYRPTVHPSLLEAHAAEQAALAKAAQYLRDKEVAEQAMTVAVAEAAKAKAITASLEANKEKAIESTAGNPAQTTKEGKK